jgi:hypothetical protein
MTKKKKPKKTPIVNRDAGDGKFVSAEFAKKHPKTTVKETVKKKPRLKKKK